HQIAEFKPPYGQPHLQAEFGQNIGACHVYLVWPRLFSAKLSHRTVGQAHSLDQMVEHHRAPERDGQRRDEQSVKAPRRDAGHRPRRVTAESVGDQPFLPEKILGPLLSGPLNASGWRDHLFLPSLGGKPRVSQEMGLVRFMRLIRLMRLIVQMSLHSNKSN